MNDFKWLILSLILFGFCGGCDITSSEELSRVTSPDSIVDAVVVRVNGGATVSYAYKVFIVPVNKKVDKENEVIRADKVDDLNVRWGNPWRLAIHYTNARIFHFSNFWQSRDVDNFQHVVEIQLITDSEKQ